LIHGNLLRDPISGSYVIVVESSSLEKIFPKTVLDNLENIINGKTEENLEEQIHQFISSFRVIPFSSLGKQNGLLLGFKPEKIIIKQEEAQSQSNAIIGIYDKKLSKQGEYHALLGLDVLERSEINHEPVGNFKI
jgi:sigma-E processing peptidase SpoIIGA